MKKLWDKLTEWLPIIWGLLWTGIITVGSVALLISAVKLLLRTMGVK